MHALHDDSEDAGYRNNPMGIDKTSSNGATISALHMDSLRIRGRLWPARTLSGTSLTSFKRFYFGIVAPRRKERQQLNLVHLGSMQRVCLAYIRPTVKDRAFRAGNRYYGLPNCMCDTWMGHMEMPSAVGVVQQA